MSAAVAGANRRWWLPPALFTIFLVGGLTAAGIVSQTAREVLAKAMMFIAGAVSTPFILEITTAIIGLFIVIGVNQWRMHKEGDGWVYLAVTEPNSSDTSEEATTLPDRLGTAAEATEKPLTADFESRMVVAEGFLELGLAPEALEHLNLLSAEEQETERAQRLLHAIRSLQI